MKIAIAATNNQINSQIDPHFGRCDWFCVYDSEKDEMEFVENETRKSERKAGYEAVSMLQAIGVQVFVASRFGSKVVEACRINDIQLVVPDDLRSIKYIIDQIKRCQK